MVNNANKARFLTIQARGIVFNNKQTLVPALYLLIIFKS